MSGLDASVEQEFFSDASPEDAARRIIRENAPFAATNIVQIAGDDTISASVRLRASQYLLDRSLGPPGADQGKDGDLEAFLKEIQNAANQGH